MNLTVEYRQSHLLSIKAHEYVAGSRLGPIQLRRSSLLYVNKGKGSLRFSSNSTIKLEPGTCLHFDGNNRFEWTIGNNVDVQATLVQYRTMTIRASGSDVSADWESEERQPRIESLLPSVAVQIGALIDRLKPLSLDCSNGGNLRKQILMDELQLLLFEHETATASPSSASDQDSLQITIDYMKQHYMKPLQIGALAQMAGLTPSSFCRAFKQLTDRTPGSYLTELRIDKAKQLMSDPNVKFTLQEFLRKVRNGNPDKGMQAWDKLLDDKQITQLYYYVIARAEKVLPPGRPDEVGPNGGRWVPPPGWPKSSH